MPHAARDPSNGNNLLVDDFARNDLRSELGTIWQGVSDRVMGGVSRAHVALTEIMGQRCLKLSGDVRLDNGGGFIQMALDLGLAESCLDASPYAGIALDVLGKDEQYELRLRTPDCIRPWQSFRAAFKATASWTAIWLPFHSFAAHRVDARLDVRRLKRLGLLAIGREFTADLAVTNIRFCSK